MAKNNADNRRDSGTPPSPWDRLRGRARKSDLPAGTRKEMVPVDEQPEPDVRVTVEVPEEPPSAPEPKRPANPAVQVVRKALETGQAPLAPPTRMSKAAKERMARDRRKQGRRSPKRKGGSFTTKMNVSCSNDWYAQAYKDMRRLGYPSMSAYIRHAVDHAQRAGDMPSYDDACAAFGLYEKAAAIKRERAGGTE